jgi:site-specific recombinase XerD
MKPTPSFAALLQRFFTERLIQQRQASPHTISSYRDTFRLLLKFTAKRLRKPPATIAFEDIDAPLIGAFLDDLQKSRRPLFLAATTRRSTSFGVRYSRGRTSRLRARAGGTVPFRRVGRLF